MSDAVQSEEIRHYEHREMRRDLERQEKTIIDVVERVGEFIDHQRQGLTDFEVRIVNEFRKLEQAIAQKTEMDSGIMARQADQKERLDRIEAEQERATETLARVAALMESGQKETMKDLDAAHDELRSHGKRISTLEKKSGKWALRVLGAAGAVLLSLGLGWLFAKLTGGKP